MGKIIHYDFRREERHKEMDEISQRATQRLIASFENSNNKLYGCNEDGTPNKEIIRQIEEDNARFLELEKEENEWGDREIWVE